MIERVEERAKVYVNGDCQIVIEQPSVRYRGGETFFEPMVPSRDESLALAKWVLDARKREAGTER